MCCWPSGSREEEARRSLRLGLSRLHDGAEIDRAAAAIVAAPPAFHPSERPLRFARDGPGDRLRMWLLAVANAAWLYGRRGLPGEQMDADVGHAYGKGSLEVKKIIADQKLDDGTVLRVGVAGGGCSGFQYSFGFDTQWDPKADTKSSSTGWPWWSTRKSDLFLDGTTLDFHEGIDKRGFTFNNPNATKSCGCGSSFQA
jgi:iron-sulfur cluster assembly protein